jgi:hypothetical protein
LRLMTSSNLVGCSIGMSRAFARAESYQHNQLRAEIGLGCLLHRI